MDNDYIQDICGAMRFIFVVRIKICSHIFVLVLLHRAMEWWSPQVYYWMTMCIVNTRNLQSLLGKKNRESSCHEHKIVHTCIWCFCPYQLVSVLVLLYQKKKKVSSTVLVMWSNAEWWDNSYSTCIPQHQLFGDVEFGQSAWQTIWHFGHGSFILSK